MGKKNRKNSGRTGGQFTELQVLNNSLKTFREVCKKIAGPSAYSQLSRTSVLTILHNRYPALRLRASAGSEIDPKQLNHLNEIFKNMVSRESVPLTSGETMPLSTFMREGLMLINYVELMGNEGLPDSPFLKSALEGYGRQQPGYLDPLRTVIQILCKFCVIMSNWNDRIFVYDINELCSIKGVEGSNAIMVRGVKPDQRFLKLEENTRELIRVGWSNIDGEVVWANTKPKWMGFREGEGCDQRCPVYIQRHALQRLEERIGLVPGLMHEAVFDLIREGNFRWHKRFEKRLVEYSVLEKRLGYLVCSFDQGLIIIRSFLFLTNTGTPEGNKLSELTRLEPLDKQYLGIDTLVGFARFRIADDPRLTRLFSDAGCEDLIHLEDIIRFTKQEIKGQDTEMLLKYLKSSPITDLIDADYEQYLAEDFQILD